MAKKNPENRKLNNQKRRHAASDTPLPQPTGLRFLDTDLIAIFLAFKVVVVATIVLSFYVFDDLYWANFGNRWFHGTESMDAWYLPFSNHDGQHYLFIADQGYSKGDTDYPLSYFYDMNYAFYPLFPMCIRLMSMVFGNIYIAALVLNLILSYLFIHLFYAYARHYLPRPDALKSIMLFLSFPPAFWLSTIYTESLFLFSLFGFIYFYQLEKSYKSVLFAAMMPLIRGQAFFVSVAVGLYMLWQWYRARKEGGPFSFRYELANILGFAVGGAAYFLYYYYTTGSFFTGMEAQKAWGEDANSLAKLINPGRFLEYVFSPTRGWYENVYGIFSKIFVLSMLFSTVFLVWAKNRLAALMFFSLVYCSAAMTGTGGSFIRYSLLAFPFLAIALLQVYPKWRAGVYALCGVFLCGQLYFAWRYTVYLWVA